MERKNDVCSFGDANVRVEAPFLERVYLVEQRSRIDDAPVAEYADLAADGSARNQRELVLLALVDDGVAGVVAALIARDDVYVVAVQVDDAALPSSPSCEPTMVTVIRRPFPAPD